MAGRNPPWARDELILALDLYFDLFPLKVPHTHPKIVELSRILNELSIHPSRPDPERFRDPNAVYLKFCNFLPYDDRYPGVGMRRGSKQDGDIFREFVNDRDRLHLLAEGIRARVPLSSVEPRLEAKVDEEESAPEGRVLFREHRVRERCPALVAKRKALALHKDGLLRCEVCGLAFAEMYGSLGEGFIECHHTRPVEEMQSGERTKVKDLALVCPNCHRMLHRGGSAMTVERLREIVQSRKAPRGTDPI